MFFYDGSRLIDAGLTRNSVVRVSPWSFKLTTKS